MESKNLYHCENLEFNYFSGSQIIPALRGVSVEINFGEFVCLSGPSGSGKSTLLNLLGMIEPVQKGVMTFKNLKVSELSETQKNHLRRHELGFIFQFFHLMPTLSAYENVEFFLLRQGINTQERRQRVKQALESVGIWDFRGQKPLELSGGQRQRVALARALAKKPAVIIADEPTASLDQKTGREVVDILLELNQQQGVTIVLASHDPMVIERSPRKLLLRDGKLT